MTSILILFPHEPFSPGRIDSEFSAEYEAARFIGFSTAFYDHEAVENFDLAEALGSLPKTGDAQKAILRGWMLPGENYSALYDALKQKGYHLQTTPEGYEQAHYLPLAYPLTEGDTPKSAWITGDDSTAAWEMYQGFQDKDAIIKDWVKSAKSCWKEGCFIPRNCSEKRFHEIYKVFRAERGKLFNRGVVLREFMPIVERGSDIKGLPIIEETRLFFWKGEPVVTPMPKHPSPLDEMDRWKSIARKFTSPFITIDTAYLTDGTWKIVEVGDGGVSGLPVTLEAERFFANLWNMVNVDSQ